MAVGETSLVASALDVVNDCVQRVAAEATRPVLLRNRLYALGWMVSISETSIGGLVTTAQDLVASVEALRATVSTEDVGAVVNAIVSLQRLVDDFGKLPAVLAPGFDTSLLAPLADDLFASLLVDALPRRLVAVFAALDLIDVSVCSELVSNGKVVRAAVARSLLKPGPFARFFRDPIGTLRALYVPNGLRTAADAEAAIAGPVGALASLTDVIGGFVTTGLTDSSPVDRRRIGIDFTIPVTNEMPVSATIDLELVPASEKLGGTGLAGPGLGITVGGTVALAGPDEPSNVHWFAKLGGNAYAFATPNGVTLVSGQLAGGIGVQLKPPTGPLLVIGADQGPRIEVASAGMEVGVSNDDISIGGMFSAKLIVPPGRDGADSFLSMFMPDGLTADLDQIALSWTLKRGLGFAGGATIGFHRALGLENGPLTIDDIGLALELGGEHGLAFAVTTGLTLAIGPVAGTVGGVGVRAMLTERERGTSFDFAFVQPTTIGLALDVGPVSGAGDISIEGGRYTGMLQLRVFNVRVTAFVQVDTQPPWSPGYSLLVMIAGEFPGIPLGFGFTLDGVGGIAGIHRAVNQDALVALVKSGGVESVLFPSSPENALALVPTINALIPPAKDRFVFAPMALIGWGPSGAPLIQARLALIIDISVGAEGVALHSITALGQADAALPSRNAAIVELHVAFMATIDLDNQKFLLLASLIDSRIAMFSISGDVALMFTWGSQPTFVLSIGGFHPAFSPPPGLPALSRLQIGCDLGIARLGITAYLAITPCSVQFGAAVNLDADFAIIRIHGDLTFDALFVFKPRFHFQIDLSAHLAIYSGPVMLAGVGVEVSISGPGEWFLRGRVRITIVFDIDVPFELHWGDPPPDTAFAAVDALALLRDAYADAANWRAESRWTGQVSYRSNNVETLDPLGEVTFAQHVIPFDQRIEQIGEAGRVPAPIRFDAPSVTIGGTATRETRSVFDSFARSNFIVMTPAEKLAESGYSSMKSGFATTLASVRASNDARETETNYKLEIWDVPGIVFSGKPLSAPVSEAGGSAVASKPSTGRGYLIVDRDTLAPREPTVYASKDDARDRWRNLSSADQRRYRVANKMDLGVAA